MEVVAGIQVTVTAIKADFCLTACGAGRTPFLLCKRSRVKWFLTCLPTI